jgi:predicted transcriptional regulator
MYKCNLSFSQLRDYLENAIRGNYLFFDETTNKYRTLEKGMTFANLHELLYKLLNTGKNEATSEDKDPYSDSKLKNGIQTALSSLISINNSFEELEFPKVNIFGVKRRDKYSIIEEILNESIKGKLKTYFMDQCNLSFKLLKSYLERLTKTNMIETKKIQIKPLSKAKKELFITTLKGQFFIQAKKLEGYLLDTGEDTDPFKDSKLIAQIEAALSPSISIEVPQDAYIVPDEGVLLRKNR